jgi:hypothetical protein
VINIQIYKSRDGKGRKALVTETIVGEPYQPSKVRHVVTIHRIDGEIRPLLEAVGILLKDRELDGSTKSA